MSEVIPSPHPRLKGSLITGRKSSPTELEPPTSKIFVIADSLYIDRDEDGPPLAAFRHQPDESIIGIVSVADGMGGSGARQAELHGEQHTMAYFAARWAQQAVESCFDAFSHEEPLSQFHTQLEARLKTEFEARTIGFISTSKLRGSSIKNFPTTLATAVMRSNKDKQEIMLLWAGDSSLTLFTPTDIYTTSQPGDGDAPMHSMVTLENQKLQFAHFIFPTDVPVLVAGTTDALLKNSNGFHGLKETVLAGMGTRDSGLARIAIRNQFQKLSPEIDDATYALCGSKVFLDESPFSCSVPTSIITEGMSIRV